MQKKKIIISIVSILFLVAIIFWITYGKDAYSNYRAEQAAQRAAKIEEEKKQIAIDSVLEARRAEQEGEQTDPFGDDNIVRVLLVGLDSRAGEEHGHCDAIQFFEIDKEKEIVSITAVPRGTYSPLPPGKGTTSSDYYVSNSCALGGLEYGVKNIEKILRNEADYLVVVGFSETLGLLRQAELPTTETLQWLRNRQGYAIGEPQRARNHSTFLKQMLVRFTPEKFSVIDKSFHYLLYSRLRTDLSFSQVEQIVAELVKMDIHNNPDKVQLFMRPSYAVQDIEYDEENIDEHLDKTVGRVSRLLSPKDYSGESVKDIQQKLLEEIEASKDDS